MAPSARSVRPTEAPPPDPGGAISLLPWLEHLKRHLPAARRGKDPEGVHQVRVATRRLGVWLELGRWRALRDDLRWLRRALGDVRDLDVLLLAEPDAPWAAWLAERRAAARREMLTALEAPRLRGLVEALLWLPPLSAATARRELRRLTRRTLRRGDALARDPDSAVHLHALRRGLRRLRYGLEWVGLDAAAPRELQDVLGAAADAALRLRVLAAWPAGAEHPELTARIEAQERAQHAPAVAAWRRLRPAIAGQA